MPRPPKTPSKVRQTPAAETAAETGLERLPRAVGAFRRGTPVRIESETERVCALAVETASDAELAAVLPDSDALLVLTHARARTLKIRLYSPDVVAIHLSRPLRAADLRAIADPTADLDEPLKGPFDAVRAALGTGYAAAVKLAKLAGLLPAAIVWTDPGVADAVTIFASEILSYDTAAIEALSIVTRARVPLEGAEHTELIAFRSGHGGPEHYAIVIGSPPTDKPVLTRLHSECFTGDLLGSLKCDCGSQLRGAIEAISKAGGGVLLYLAQEGRGIGLVNKLRAYRLQDQGFDTVEANQRLGFEPDERLYGIAAHMLRLLGYKSVRLLTNNPDKMKSLEAEGIPVVERVPHAFPANPHNRAYLKTKTEKAGHLF